MDPVHCLEDLLVLIRDDEALRACQRLPAPLATMGRLLERPPYQSDLLEPTLHHRKRVEHSMVVPERILRSVDTLVADDPVVSRLKSIGQVPANGASIADIREVIPQ